ncbi:MAG: hypothetical protein Q8930_16475 [Bacillota bacterium]|nr:hypothetical protein [Bacillota bacterium]
MSKRSYIIDRSISEIAHVKTVDWQQLSHFAQRLVKLGVDLLELDAGSIRVMHDVNKGFIYRVNDRKDLAALHGRKPEAIIVRYEDILELQQVKINNRFIIELQHSSIDWMKQMADGNFLNMLSQNSNIFCIRLLGMEDLEEEEYIEYICGQTREFRIDICPYDTKGMAAAIAVESMERGADYLTTSFCGFGCSGTAYAPTEEVMMARKVIYGEEVNYYTEQLTEMAADFEKLTGKKIPNQKPILGTDIFKCESGIHVDGILKDPNTYEPYPPEIVGKKREFVIGKHSGRRRLQKGS